MADTPETSYEGGQYTFGDFSFNWTSEVQKAYEKLRPYYEKMLEFAQGDFDLAKKMIEFTYTQGLRESKSEFELASREQAITFPGEQEAFWGQAGQRGIVGGATAKEPGGGLIGQEMGRLKESQAIRKEAIDRALEFKETRLESEKGFGTEQTTREFERGKQTMSREQEKESAGMASSKFGRQFGIAQAEEQRKQAARAEALTKESIALQREAMEKAYG